MKDEAIKEHIHVHRHTKAVHNRLLKAKGHLGSVAKMVERNEDCSDILIQLSAVISALNNAGKVIVKDHIDHCLYDALKNGDKKAVENLKTAIESFMK